MSKRCEEDCETISECNCYVNHERSKTLMDTYCVYRLRTTDENGNHLICKNCEFFDSSICISYPYWNNNTDTQILCHIFETKPDILETLGLRCIADIDEIIRQRKERLKYGR